MVTRGKSTISKALFSILHLGAWRASSSTGYHSRRQDMYGRSLTRPAATATDKWGNWGQVGVYNQIQGGGTWRDEGIWI